MVIHSIANDSKEKAPGSWRLAGCTTKTAVNKTIIIILCVTAKVNKIKAGNHFSVLVIDINKSTTLLIYINNHRGGRQNEEK